MLAQALQTRGCLVQAVSASSLAGEVVDLVAQHKPDVVCIAATPPAAVIRARHLARQVRASFPKVNLVVGLWDAQGDLMKFKERIGCGAVVVATLVEAQEQVRLLVQSLVPPPEKPIQLERGLGVVEKKHR